MAKAKKQLLSLEERLEQALIPESEQPYSVPENWVWTKLGTIAVVASGGTPSTSVEAYYSNGTIPWITPADLSDYEKAFIKYGAKNITQSGLEKSSAKLLPKNTVLLSSRAPIGYVAIAENELCTNQGFKSFIPSPCYLPKYLYWYLKGITHILESQASGTTFLELSASKVKMVEIPLAPINEQQRIVTQIESLFQKLDSARNLVQNALDSFETCKAAILHKAFTGELTTGWRFENNVEIDNWKHISLIEVCSKITDGTHHSPKNYSSGEFMYITAKNIKENRLDLSHITYVSSKDHAEIYARCNVEYGDVLYIKDGATTGIAALNNISEEFSMLSSVALLKPNKDLIMSEYIVYYLNSPEVKSLMVNNMSGNAITRLTIAKIKRAPILAPTIPEQQEIVRILDSLLGNEQKAKDLCDILDKIDLMKKAILARAFRGELGTNDPTEESAKELLKEILQSQAS